MKIAVVGTSNSVMRNGWVPRLREMLPTGWALDNYSVGGSASLHGSFSIDAAKVAENYDFAIIDFAINDQQMIDTANMSVEYVAASFAALLRHFAEPNARCTPIVVIIPQRDLISHDRQDQTYNITVKSCERYGVAYIDLYELLRRLAREDGVDPKGCFSDWTHLQPFAQEALAKAALRALQGTKPGRRPSERLLTEAPRCHAVAGDDVEVNQEIRQELGTSLAKKEVRTLEAGARGVIRNIRYLCGIVHWIDPGSGSLCFDGEDRKVKKGLRKEWTRLFALTLFKTPLKAKDAVIPFHFGDSEDYVFERTFGMTPKTPVAGTRADIVGFIGCDADPLVAGRALLKAVGGASTPPTTRKEQLDLNIAYTLLASWVSSSRDRPEASPPKPSVQEPVMKPEPEPVTVEAKASVTYSRPAPHVASVRIPDGCRTTVELPISFGVMIIVSEVSMLRATIGFRCGLRPQLHNLGIPVSNLKLVAGSLAELPPQDKHLTLGLGQGDKLEIENCRGGLVDMTLFFFG